MANACFRFYEELNDFLPPQRRKIRFTHSFSERASIKDMIEALGVPHTEIDLILVNGRSVDFSYIVQDRDCISVYPMFEAFDIAPLVRVRPQPLRETRFVADVHLGKLARYLRLLGFDTLYRTHCDDAELARLAHEQKRILLTRDRGLLKRSLVTHGLYVRATDPRRQVREIIGRLDLRRSLRPFQRCARCNGQVRPVAKEQILERLGPNTKRYFQDFWMCRECRQIYWKGSHYQKMQALIQDLQRDTV